MNRRLGLGAFLGACLGAGLAAIQPLRHEARTTVQFSAVNPQLATHFMKALSAVPEEAVPVNFAETVSSQSQTATLILSSRAAAEHAREKAGLAGSPEQLLANLNVRPSPPSALILTLSARSSTAAKDQLLGLLDYYQQFVVKNSLTRVKKTRIFTQTRLTRVRKTLARLEDQLSRSQSKELRRMGDATLKVNPKVMHEVWVRRVDEEGKARLLLARLQQLRAGQKLENGDEKWLAQWAAGRKSQVRYAQGLFNKPVSRQELLERAQQERDYYEALLLHRSLTLQLSFLATWEALESPEFEVIEPVNVRRLDKAFLYPTLFGSLAGLLLAGLRTRKG